MSGESSGELNGEFSLHHYINEELESYRRQFFTLLREGQNPIYDPPSGLTHPEDEGIPFVVSCPGCGIRQRIVPVWGSWPEREKCPFCSSAYGEERVAAARAGARSTRKGGRGMSRAFSLLCLLVVLAGVAVVGIGATSGDLWSSTVMTVSGALMVMVAVILLARGFPEIEVRLLIYGDEDDRG